MLYSPNWVTCEVPLTEVAADAEITGSAVSVSAADAIHAAAYKTIPSFSWKFSFPAGQKIFVPGMLNVFLCMYIS